MPQSVLFVDLGLDRSEPGQVITLYVKATSPKGLALKVLRGLADRLDVTVFDRVHPGLLFPPKITLHVTKLRSSAARQVQEISLLELFLLLKLSQLPGYRVFEPLVYYLQVIGCILI